MRKPANQISLTEIKNAFYIDENYRLRWKIKRWKMKPGDLAGGFNGNYLAICYKTIETTAHRVLFQIYNNIEYLDPTLEIDHINGNHLDNSPENLRLANRAENKRNSKLPTNNHSGYKGVHWNKKCKKWHCQIRYMKKPIYLGVYLDPLEAHLAYCKKAKELFGEYWNPGY